MSEGYPTARGLYELTEATPAQLAAYIDTTEDVVERDFASHPDLFEHPGMADAGIWRLSHSGREKVEAELSLMRMRGHVPDPDAAERRVLNAIATIEADLLQLSDDPHVTDADDFLDLLDLRLKATGKSIRRLEAAGRTVEVATRRIAASLRRIEEIRTTRLRPADDAKMAEEVETSVQSYVRAWVDLWPGEDKFVPERVTSGPIVVVNGTAEGEVVAQRIVEEARTASSPVIAIQAKDPSASRAARELDCLGEFLSSVAGAATKVVFVVDGRAAVSQALALRCVKLDHVRATSRHEFNPAAPYVRLTSVMQATLHVAQQTKGNEMAFVDFFEHRVSSMVRSVTWAILRLVTPSQRLERRRSWSVLDPSVVCIDVGGDSRLATNFEGTTVSYLGLSDFNAKKGSSIEPWDGPRHLSFAGSMIPWPSTIPPDQGVSLTSGGTKALIAPPIQAVDVQASAREDVGGGALVSY